MIRLPPKSALYPYTTLFQSAAVKNYADVAVVTDPGQYGAVLRELEANDGLGLAFRERLVAAAFARNAAYDAAISSYFRTDRKSTRLNSSHANISYAVFCLIK